MKGKIVLIPFPFTDLTGSKPRPALVIAEVGEDVIAAFITSRVTLLTSTSILIKEGTPEYRATGLKTTSILRLDKVATISRDLVMGEIGEVVNPLKDEINKRLSEIFRL